MFSKIKEVLVSLTLATSLALAPMNVSTANLQLTDQDQTGKTKVLYKEMELTGITYTVEVPEQIEFTSKKMSTLVSIRVTQTSNPRATIVITPTFEAGKTYSKVSMSFYGSKVAIYGVTTGSTKATLSDDSNELNEDKTTSTEIGTIKYNIATMAWYL